MNTRIMTLNFCSALVPLLLSSTLAFASSSLSCVTGPPNATGLEAQALQYSKIGSPFTIECSISDSKGQKHLVSDPILARGEGYGATSIEDTFKSKKGTLFRLSVGMVGLGADYGFEFNFKDNPKVTSTNPVCISNESFFVQELTAYAIKDYDPKIIYEVSSKTCTENTIDDVNYQKNCQFLNNGKGRGSFTGFLKGGKELGTTLSQAFVELTVEGVTIKCHAAHVKQLNLVRII